jgi:hypothetical protein
MWTIKQCARCGSSITDHGDVTVCDSGTEWCLATPRAGREQIASGTPEVISGEYRTHDLSLNEALMLLDVRPLPGYDGTQLLVDASKALPGPNGPQFWTLYLEPDGRWTHPESGTCLPLASALAGIASAYQRGVVRT